MDFFTILSAPRAGSNLLCGLLDSHPIARCHNEIFHHESVGLVLPKCKKINQLFDKDWRDHSPSLFIEEMLKKTQYFSRRTLRAVGCKILLNEDQINKGLAAIFEFNPRIIFLTRRNKLAWYSSQQIAACTGIWMTAKQSEQQQCIFFDEATFMQMVNQQEALEEAVFAKVKAQGLTYLKITYEDLADPTRISNILNFLGLPNTQLFVDIAKQNTSQILDR
ncbi:MAG TPA: Stf0 family sulfotransferase, partial [Gammaproteobacteria bacterium]|nr:Stf0 family sulfotransferase [Gammaproteobacteria bacterium]